MKVGAVVGADVWLSDGFDDGELVSWDPVVLGFGGDDGGFIGSYL